MDASVGTTASCLMGCGDWFGGGGGGGRAGEAAGTGVCTDVINKLPVTVDGCTRGLATGLLRASSAETVDDVVETVEEAVATVEATGGRPIEAARRFGVGGCGTRETIWAIWAAGIVVGVGAIGCASCDANEDVPNNERLPGATIPVLAEPAFVLALLPTTCWTPPLLVADELTGCAVEKIKKIDTIMVWPKLKRKLGLNEGIVKYTTQNSSLFKLDISLRIFYHQYHDTIRRAPTCISQNFR